MMRKKILRTINEELRRELPTESYVAMKYACRRKAKTRDTYSV